jgi:uncharacterized SAM-binding protein YcdF (DUF218 family)
MLPDQLLLFLSKLLPIFVLPLGLTLSLAVVGALLWLLYYRRLARLFLGAALAILWICSTPVVANWATASLEQQYPPRTMAETPAADVAVVLGGVLGQPEPPRVAVELTDTSDRVLHATRLYRAGKVKRILVSAGNIPWTPAIKPEAELIRELLIEWGVPADAIEVGTESRNTFENALEIQRMLKSKGFRSALLVTSATHMPRAMATFRHARVPVMASTTDVSVVDSVHADPLRWLPNAGALAATTTAMREWLGYLAYRVRGYL